MSTNVPCDFDPLIHFLFQLLSAQVVPGSGDAQVSVTQSLGVGAHMAQHGKCHTGGMFPGGQSWQYHPRMGTASISGVPEV